MANYKRRVDQLIDRFKNQTIRHDRLISVWEATSIRAQKAESVIVAKDNELNQKLELIEFQKEKISGFDNLTKKEKRKSWLNGAMVGSGVTLVAIIVVMILVP